jgi:hypothetical protein
LENEPPPKTWHLHDEALQRTEKTGLKLKQKWGCWLLGTHPRPPQQLPLKTTVGTSLLLLRPPDWVLLLLLLPLGQVLLVVAAMKEE